LDPRGRKRFCWRRRFRIRLGVFLHRKEASAAAHYTAHGRILHHPYHRPDEAHNNHEGGEEPACSVGGGRPTRAREALHSAPALSCRERNRYRRYPTRRGNCSRLRQEEEGNGIRDSLGGGEQRPVFLNLTPRSSGAMKVLGDGGKRRTSTAPKAEEAVRLPLGGGKRRSEESFFFFFFFSVRRQRFPSTLPPPCRAPSASPADGRFLFGRTAVHPPACTTWWPRS
jgi:hypothetical protein